MAQAPFAPSFLGMEPFPTPPGIDTNILGQSTVRHLPMRDYGFLDEWSLSEYDHPSEWVITMAKFVGKAKVKPEKGFTFEIICSMMMSLRSKTPQTTDMITLL